MIRHNSYLERISSSELKQIGNVAFKNHNIKDPNFRSERFLMCCKKCKKATTFFTSHEMSLNCAVIFLKRWNFDASWSERMLFFVSTMLLNEETNLGYVL